MRYYWYIFIIIYIYIDLDIDIATQFSIPCLHLDWRWKIPQKLFPQIFNPPNLREGLKIWRQSPCGIFNLQSEEEKAWRYRAIHLLVSWCTYMKKHSTMSCSNHRPLVTGVPRPPRPDAVLGVREPDPGLRSCRTNWRHLQYNTSARHRCTTSRFLWPKMFLSFW